ncbi:MAG: translation initiation factor IF-2 [Nitrospinae bacterium]|nr:translation initiation factor IF-2 [Nitrospinota bacterium]
MSGIRIYELAKDIGVQSKTLVDIIGKMGYPVKSHSSTIDNNLADRLRKQVAAMGIATKPKKARPKAEAPKEPEKPVAVKPSKETGKKPVQHAEKKEHAAAEPITAATEIPAAVTAPVTQEPPAAPKAEPEAEPVKKEIKPVVPVPPAAHVHPAQARRPEGVKPAAPHPPRVEHRPEEKRDFRQKPQHPRPHTPPAAPSAPKRPAGETEEKPRRRDEGRDRWERKRDEEERKRLERLRRKEDDEIKRKAAAETKKKERELEEVRRKQRAEEAEIQRLIDEEERAKREIEARKIVIDEATTVKEFAEKLRLGVNEIIGKLIGKGIMANLNQTIDAEVAKELALELGYEIKTREEDETEVAEKEVEDVSKLLLRPPVVTIMGHVDHGKTSLLDTIRKTSVTETEAGGITQKIGAYSVKLEKGTVVFLDTPGHEAFTALRARGAAVTDIVVLVVAADDGVMPQTVEAIHHAKAAGVPVLVAVNKIDKPGAAPDKIKQELAGHELVPEEWGGTTIFCEVSAKKNIGIEHLLEMLLLQAEVLELKANPEREAFGVVIESKLDKGRGPVATVLVKKGTLKIGDPFVAGAHYGKVRALMDDKGRRIDHSGPSTPVEVIGFSGVPVAGETFMVTESERKAHQIAITRINAEKAEGAKAKHLKLENLHAQVTRGSVKDLNIIIKADFQGSIEGVKKALEDINVGDVRIRVLHGAVGGITETDISLAAASDAIVIGFNVRPTEKARSMAETEGVDVRLYSIIYNAVDDIKAALEGMLEPVFAEKVTGRAEVRNTFNITKIGTIAGCVVSSGKITRGSDARLIRDNVVIYTGKVSSLKRFKEDAREVANGYECGIGVGYNDVKIGDAVETFVVEKVERKTD